jgi:hypothetical protein
MTVLNDKHKNNDKVPKEWQKDSISIFQHGIVSHLFAFTTEDSVEQEKEGEPLPNAFSSALGFISATAKKFNGTDQFLRN